MRPFSRYLPAAIILLLGLGATFATTAWVGRWERLSRQSEFQRQINNLATALQRTTNRYNELLLSIGDFYAANDNEVSEQEFRQFVQRAVDTYPGIQALEWAPLVTRSLRDAYEQELRRDTGQPNIGITERGDAGALVPAADRPSYVPVTFLEPWQTNEPALGYDLASDATRRVALERARDTGALAATGRIQLVQETAENQYSFLVFLPVYSRPASTPVARRRALRGYILGVFRVADVVEESFANLDNEIDFFVLDQTARADEQLLGFYDADRQQVISDVSGAEPLFNLDSKNLSLPGNQNLCPVGLDCTQTLTLGQREWQLVFLPPRHPSPPWAALATMLIGLLITAILLVYLSRWQSELQRTRELSNLKLRLFSMASHELRTPLSVITVSAQSMEANRELLSPEQQQNTINRIQSAARRMGQLVEDILTLTRAEAGKLEVNPEIVEIAPFCYQLFDQIQLKPRQRLILEGNARKTKAFLGKKLLHSILANLLTNAAKYSAPDSMIQLIVSATPDHLQFQVIDQGIGISEAAQRNIFNAFYRGENVGEIQGVGLGLAVVKTCVDLQHGSIDIVSKPKEGTCITVTLPRVE
jgi:signal transduction histidine kinase